ncbi:MAG: ABC transporter permease [Propionibacteriaceae bacterium]
MLRLIFSDLIAHLRVWVGMAIIAAATALVAAVVASDVETAVGLGGNVALALYAISGSVILFTSVAAVIVLSSVANLTVVLQQRDYALWQLVGVRGSLVGIVVLTQLVVVALVGAWVGIALSVPVLQPFFDYVFADLPGFGSVPVQFGPAGVTSVLGFVTVIVLLSGVRSARRASQVTGVAVLADPDPPQTTMGPLRWVGVLAVLGLLCALLLSIRATPVDRLEVPLWIIGPLVASLLVCLGPLIFPSVLRGWTALVPARWSVSWFLARSAALHSIGRSTAAVNPLMVAVALAGGLYSANGTVRAAERVGAAGAITIGTVVLLLGGPLLLSALGSAVTIFMSARVRDREAALVRATGGTPEVVMATAAWEAFIYVVTAVLLGAVGVIATALVGAWAVASDAPGTFPRFGAGAVGVVAGAELLLVMVATVVPAGLGVRRDVAATLAAE